MKIKLFLTTLFTAFGLTQAQAGHHTDEEQIRAVVDQFFVGLKERDLSLWEDIMVPEGTVMVSREKDGEWTFSSRGIGRDMARLETDTALIDERWFDATILIHETIAVVWTPYDIYVNGEFAHCGIDVFQMMKIEGKWKIAQLAYTIEPEGCGAFNVPPKE